MSMSKKSSKKCGPGEIMRKGYQRKGYQRNEYTRKTGTTIPATYVSAAEVPPICIKDVGKPGKGPKTLPKPDNLVHLSKYGYSIHRPEPERRAALRAAIKDYNTLLILRRLNLLRNYQAIPENKEIFTKDVEYMKKLYSNIKQSKPRSNKQSKYSNKQSLHGGSDSLFQDPLTSDMTEISETSETSDYVVDKINLPEPRTVEINTIVDREKMCDGEGKCGVRNIIYESHIVDDREIIFYTLGEKDADQILELDKMYLDSDQYKNSVMEKIIDNRGLLIGIKVDNILQGYCQYEPLENLEVKIVWFCANKGYGTPLYTFIEKYFRLNDFTRVVLVVSLEGSYSTRRINFWYRMGFNTYETLPEKNKIHMEKNI